MKRFAMAGLTAAFACLAAAPVAAGDAPMTGAQWQQLSPEEKEARRQAAREQWQRLSPEDKEARRKAARERYESLPPEQQVRVRQRIAERRAARLQ